MFNLREMQVIDFANFSNYSAISILQYSEKNLKKGE